MSTPKYLQVNPATGETGRGYAVMDPDAVREILARGDAAFRDWRRTSYEARGAVLRRTAVALRARQGEFARLMALEMGKPLAQGEAETEKCAWALEHYADHGARYLADEPVATEAGTSYVHFEPLGLVLAIMPWNYPFWQLFRFAAPALMAGNGILLKHAANVPGCALAIESVLHEGGVPPDLVRNLFVTNDQAGEVIGMPEVRAVTLTGSTRAGRAVAATAGRHLKKVVLELGGSDAYVVLADADVPAAASACVTGRMVNTGQSCVAAKRWIVVRDVLEDFTSHVRDGLAGYVLGDPLAAGTTAGPMAREDLRDELDEQVQRSVAAGARLLLGGETPDRTGAWYPVTLLADVAPGMAAFDEELFGPVAAIVPAEDEADALRLANASDYGLGAAVFTQDAARGERIARADLEAGCCFVNTFVRSDPRLPFGGVKDSGYGRELGAHGIREFVNVKTVYVG